MDGVCARVGGAVPLGWVSGSAVWVLLEERRKVWVWGLGLWLWVRVWVWVWIQRTTDRTAVMGEEQKGVGG